MSKLNYVIVGAKPPPRGGVAVYLERKSSLLRAQGESVVWQNPRKIFSFVALLFKMAIIKEDRIIELHTANPIALALVCLFRIESMMIFYDHNYSHSFENRKGFSRFLLKHFISRVGSVVVVGEHLRGNYKSFQLKVCNDFKVEVPYIALSAVSMKVESISGFVHEFVVRHKVCFINAAWRLSDDESGEDLYGIQWSIESFLEVFGDSSDVGFVAIVGSGNREKLEGVRKMCEKKSHILLLEGEYDLCNFLAGGGFILLRTTTTDGDSLSVREAIELGVPVIASDVVPRPIGTQLYKLHSRTSFEDALKSEVQKTLIY